MKNRIYALDFIRVISAFGIICHHFCRELQSKGIQTNIWLGGDYKNGNYGWFFVTLFFILSGIVLHMNYPEVKVHDLKDFYFKRWKSTFPIFYLAWLYYYLYNVLEFGKIFYCGNPFRILWTIIGVDGYISCRFPTYYILGEWYLGAIVFLYLIYPLIIYLYNKSRLLSGGGILILFFLVDYTNISFQSGPFRSIISCLLSFYIGMILLDFRITVEHGRPCLILSFVLAFILFFMKIPIISANIQVHILGTVCFIIFWRIGKKVMTFANAKTFIMLLSHISYPVFLLQHVVISQIVRNIVWDNLSMTKYLIFLILCYHSQPF